MNVGSFLVHTHATEGKAGNPVRNGFVAVGVLHSSITELLTAKESTHFDPLCSDAK